MDLWCHHAGEVSVCDITTFDVPPPENAGEVSVCDITTFNVPLPENAGTQDFQRWALQNDTTQDITPNTYKKQFTSMRYYNLVYCFMISNDFICF